MPRCTAGGFVTGATSYFMTTCSPSILVSVRYPETEVLPSKINVAVPPGGVQHVLAREPLAVSPQLDYTVNSLVDASLAHDRAAAELGMEPYNGGPFAVPALPQGRPLLGGAR